MTINTCTHGDASAIEFAECGQPQEWICEDGCGLSFTITKPHYVQSGACGDCGREFPADTETDTTGDDPVIMFD